jgi:hypothetical protein
MSSSSSLSAARRRRAGGATGNANASRPNPQQATQQASQSTGPAVNPFILIQQHDFKIARIENAIKELMFFKQSIEDTPVTETKQTKKPQNVTSKHTTPTPPAPIEIDEISKMVMDKIDESYDFQVFFNNLEALSAEVTEYRNMVNSQQVYMNALSLTLLKIVDKLNIDLNEVTNVEKKEGESSESQGGVELTISEKIHNAADDDTQSEDNNFEPITFPSKSVTFGEENTVANNGPSYDPNDLSEYTKINEENEDGLAIEPVD